jgi:hypothetical protein
VKRVPACADEALPIPGVIQSRIETQADAAPRAYDDLRAVLDAGACVLAAGDAFHTLGEPRPHRRALETAAAAQSRCSTPRIASLAPLA